MKIYKILRDFFETQMASKIPTDEEDNYYVDIDYKIDALEE